MTDSLDGGAIVLPEELVRLADTRALLQDNLRSELQILVDAACEEAAARQRLLDEYSFFGKCLIYSGALLYGAAQVVGLVDDEVPAAFVAPAGSVASECGADGGGALGGFSISAIADAIAKEAEIAFDEVGKAAHLICDVASDPETWAILWDFQSCFIESLHTTVVLEQAGGLIPGLIASLVTGTPVGLVANLALKSKTIARVLQTVSRCLKHLQPIWRRIKEFLDPRLVMDRVSPQAIERYLFTYMKEPAVMQEVHRQGDSPFCACLLYAPRIRRRRPFLGVSLWAEQTLHPEIVARVNAIKIARMLPSHSGSCAEVVAISRALAVQTGGEEFRKKGGRLHRSKLRAAGRLGGALCTSFEIPLKGRRIRADEREAVARGEKTIGDLPLRGSYKAGSGTYAKHKERWGQHKEACDACKLILAHYRILEIRIELPAQA